MTWCATRWPSHAGRAVPMQQHPLRPGASDHQLKRVGQLSIVIVSIAAVGVALLLQQSKSTIFDTLQSIIGFFAPPVTTVFLFSLLWKRATTKGVLATLYAGTAISLTVGAGSGSASSFNNSSAMRSRDKAIRSLAREQQAAMAAGSGSPWP